MIVAVTNQTKPRPWRTTILFLEQKKGTAINTAATIDSVRDEEVLQRKEKHLAKISHNICKCWIMFWKMELQLYIFQLLKSPIEFSLRPGFLVKRHSFINESLDMLLCSWPSDQYLTAIKFLKWFVSFWWDIIPSWIIFRTCEFDTNTWCTDIDVGGE